MGITVNLDNQLVENARIYSAVQSRSIPKQIEYWARIGKIVEENPELRYDSIKDILLGLEDVKSGNLEAYDPQ